MLPEMGTVRADTQELEGDEEARGHNCDFCLDPASAIYTCTPVDALTDQVTQFGMTYLCVGHDEMYPSLTDHVFFCHDCSRNVLERADWQRDAHLDGEGDPLCELCVEQNAR